LPLLRLKIPHHANRIAGNAHVMIEWAAFGGRVDPHGEEPKPPNGELRNIYACRSSVNLVMPKEQNVEQLDDDEAFMENLKLRHVASNFDDLARKLQHRFDDLPLQRLC
jgi:hypothetical protein